MSSRKSPPPPTQPKSHASGEQRLDKGKSREVPRPPSRAPSHSHHRSHAGSGDEDDAPPTSTLRARNVTGNSTLQFPPSPSTLGSGDSSRMAVDGGGGVPGGWRLPSVKGTIGGLASPSQSTFAGSSAPSSATIQNFAHREEQGNGTAQPASHPRPPITFRTDPTVASCLDTMPLGSRDELKRLFGVA